MQSSSYYMPVVAQELPPVESLHTLFDNLKHLDAVVNDCFSRIQSRVNFEKTKISNICARIANCQTQVERIKANASKATTVYSIAKYPAPVTLPNYPLTYSEFVEHGLTHVTRSEYTLTREEQRARGERVDTSELFMKLTDASRKELALSVNSKQEGLGRLPSHLPSVSSILLFNTAENPYKKYVSLDNLEGVIGKDREKKSREVAAAPRTLIDGDILPVFAGQDFGFKPKMGDVPTFALPSMLPDLPGVADISWSMDAKQSIAPSSVSILALPSLDNFAFSHAPPPAPLKVNPTISSYAPLSNIPPPPAKPLTTGPPVLGGPPLGPPIAGPPIGPPVSKPPGPPPQVIAPPPATTSEPGRNALLESIRNPGMALRKVAKLLESGEEPPLPSGVKSTSAIGEGAASGNEKAKKNNAPPPMDMMTALAQKLNARKKAMSGRPDEEDRPSKPVVAKRETVEQQPLVQGKSMANVDAYLKHKESKAPRKEDKDDDWED